MGKLAANTKDIDLGEEADELRVESVVAEVVLLAGARGRRVGAALAAPVGSLRPVPPGGSWPSGRRARRGPRRASRRSIAGCRR